MGKETDLMFEYLKNLLYSPEKATLDIGQLPEDFQSLGQGLLYFGQALSEVRVLSGALARGEFDVPMPAQDNELAAPLKALHASLKHLTWQTQQVAKGDYGQHVDFMGDFSTAFNQMTMQLEQRQRALKEEIAQVRRQTEALQKSNDLLEAITNELDQRILVVDAANGTVLFRNRAAQQTLTESPALDAAILDGVLVPENLDPQVPLNRELELLQGNGENMYISVSAHPIQWRQVKSVALIIRDISADVFRRRQLEVYAYRDPLTKLFNRHYGMNNLEDMINTNDAFCLCFIDLDNLKFVNDSFGHSEGDSYIILAADHLAAACPQAMASRIGGDEFMLLLPGVGRKVAETLMHDCRDTLMETARKEERKYLCSISFGVAEFTPGENITSSELLELADKRMYAFKKRNKRGRGLILDYSWRDSQEP